MAHFQGILQGARQDVSRLGTKQSGILAHANGWNFGGKISLQHYSGIDEIDFSITGGSNGNKKIDLEVMCNENGDITIFVDNVKIYSKGEKE